jgi:hypothetical protein
MADAHVEMAKNHPQFIMRNNTGMVMKTRSIQPVVKIVRLSSPKSDFIFWQSQPFDDRLSTLE